MSGNDLIIPEEIRSRIYTIRGLQVMLDEDLALLYGVETKVLNQAVKRNSERFPEDFLFQLSEEEYKLLRSQNVTIEDRRGQHRKYLPYAFSEQGECTIPMHICKGVHKKAIELCIGAEGILTKLEGMKA